MGMGKPDVKKCWIDMHRKYAVHLKNREHGQSKQTLGRSLRANVHAVAFLFFITKIAMITDIIAK